MDRSEYERLESQQMQRFIRENQSARDQFDADSARLIKASSIGDADALRGLSDDLISRLAGRAEEGRDGDSESHGEGGADRTGTGDVGPAASDENESAAPEESGG